MAVKRLAEFPSSEQLSWCVIGACGLRNSDCIGCCMNIMTPVTILVCAFGENILDGFVHSLYLAISLGVVGSCLDVADVVSVGEDS